MDIKITRNEHGCYVVESPGYPSWVTGAWNVMVFYVISPLRNI